MVAVSIGVDVGTGSVRAGAINASTGVLLGVEKSDIHTWSTLPEHSTQSGDEIWAAVCTTVRGAMARSGVGPDDVIGIAFDATCSLVCIDASGAPVGVDASEPHLHERNVILWADHRANEQASRINKMYHAGQPAVGRRLLTVGGVISPEMEMPKILWLKEHMPAAYARVVEGGSFFDLADFLTYRAAGSVAVPRSLCTVVCKWNYDANAQGSGVGWDAAYMEAINLSEISAAVIGESVALPGAAVAGGVGAAAAEALGLRPGTALAVGMIDAHAGGVGCLGAALPTEPTAACSALEGRVAIVSGTSTCHMASSRAACFVQGVWGPYYGAMFEGLYLNEGGQSAAGALIDHLIDTHAACAAIAEEAAAQSVPRTSVLNQRLERMAAAAGVPVALLTAELHVCPDFAGNRSPLACPSMRGGIVGLRLSASEEDLALLYLAATQALAYQTRHILLAMEEAGHTPFTSLYLCGGLSKNALYAQSHADILNMAVRLPREEEAVLLGAGILAATAGGAHATISAAMVAMSGEGGVITPSESAEVLAFHERKYRVFRRLSDDQVAYRAMMAEGAV